MVNPTVNIVKLFPKRVSQIYLRLSIITELPILISLFTKSLCLGLGYPIVHEKNAPKGKPFETRARILLEIMKEPLPRTKLKERLNDVSTKTIDYHIQRAKDSLLNLKIVAEEDNRLKLNKKKPKDLINMIEILKAQKELGSIVQKSLDTVFVECFISGFGNLVDIRREKSHELTSAMVLFTVHHNNKESAYFNKISMKNYGFESYGYTTFENYVDSEESNDRNISVILEFSKKIFGELSLSFKVDYILKVLGNVWQANECFLINKIKEVGNIDITEREFFSIREYCAEKGASNIDTTERKFINKRIKRLNSDLDCQLFNFTNWYTKPWTIEQEVNNIINIFPELLEYFYQKVIFEPLLMEAPPFELIDGEIFLCRDFPYRGAYSALEIINMLLDQITLDQTEDVHYNPFESKFISTVSNKWSEVKYPEFRRLNLFTEEYVKLRLKRAGDLLAGKNKNSGNLLDRGY